MKYRDATLPKRLIVNHLIYLSRYSHVVVDSSVVELCEAPVDKFKNLILRINDDILRLHIAMHDAFAVGVVKRLHNRKNNVAFHILSDTTRCFSHLKQLEEIEAYLEVGEARELATEIHVLDLLEDLARPKENDMKN